MTIKEYTDDCVQFAKDSRKWSMVPPHRYFTTNGNGWVESCDNANGGIDVSWAFGRTLANVRKEAPQRFADNISELLQLAMDDEWEPSELHLIRDLMV